MANINFPVGLPCGLRAGYALRAVSPLVRTQMVTGRAKQRRAFTDVPVMADVEWIFSSAEARVFEAWFRDAIRDGADWFNVPLRTPMDDTAHPGLGIYECRFADIYSGPRPTGKSAWLYSGRLEISRRPLLPRGWGLFPDYALHADIIDSAINSHWPELLASGTLNLTVTVDGQQRNLLVSRDGISLVPLQVEV